MNIARHAILVTLATSFSIPAIAEEQSPIIVTATRTVQTVDDTLASVTVITREQIEQQQAHDLVALLTSVSGIDMVNNGGLGKTSSILMRGTSSKHVLVMIDGIKIGSATLGSIAFENIPLSQVERIEIVRGPRSSLYGSNAIGGIIQIFTREGKGDATFNAELGYGSDNLTKVNAGFSGKANNTSYSINAGYLSTDGFDSLQSNNNDEDGYENASLSANIKQELSNTSSLAFNFLHATGTNEYDSSYYPSAFMESDFTQTSGGITYTAAPMKSWELILKASQSHDKNENFQNNVDTGVFITDRDMYSWQNNFTFSDDLILTAGVDFQKDKVSSSTTTYDKTSRDNTGYYVQQQWLGNKNDLTAALRLDDNQTFGNKTTGNIAWGHSFANATKIITSYGTAFKAPTFNDLYWPDTGFGGGNPNLKPEESNTTEIELRKKHAWGKTSVSVYNTQIENLISGWPPVNVNKAEISGIEIRLSTNIFGWETKAEYALLDPRDTVTDKILQYRSQQTLRIDMDKKAGKWSTGMSFIGQGYRFNDTANTDRVSGYGIINLRASYAMTKKLLVKWKIDNVLDKKYEITRDYNNSGITGFVSLVYQGI
jgi:vitamin B12 transporter